MLDVVCFFFFFFCKFLGALIFFNYDEIVRVFQFLQVPIFTYFSNPQVKSVSNIFNLKLSKDYDLIAFNSHF